MRYKLSRRMLLEKHSHKCCIPLKKNSRKSSNIWSKHCINYEAERYLVWGRDSPSGCSVQPCLCCDAVCPGETTVNPEQFLWVGPPELRFLPTCSLVPVPSGALLSQSLLSPKRPLWAVSVPAGRQERRSERLGGSRTLSLSGQRILLHVLDGGEHTVEALTLQLLREAKSWTGNLREISLEDRFHPEMKETES